jgi:hypothetical protein
MENLIKNSILSDMNELKIKNIQLESIVKKLEERIKILENNKIENKIENKNIKIFKNGFELDKNLINNSLIQHSLNADFILIKEYYFKKNNSFKLENNTIQYYFNDMWIDENEDLYDVLILNITNTYLTIIQENEFKLLGEDDEHINHIMRIEKTVKYRKELKKLLKNYINNI